MEEGEEMKTATLNRGTLKKVRTKLNRSFGVATESDKNCSF
jgi:hypothetical protein